MALKKKAHGTEQTSDLQIWKCRRKNIKRRADIFTDAFCVCVCCVTVQQWPFGSPFPIALLIQKLSPKTNTDVCKTGRKGGDLNR